MVVRCDKCQARYRIDDSRVGPSGLTLKCGKCGNLFPATPAPAKAPRAAAAPKAAPRASPAAAAPRSALAAAAPKAAPARAASPAGRPGPGAERTAPRKVRSARRALGLLAAIAALLVLLAAFVASKRADAGRPPEAAVRSLARANALADLDALPAFPQAAEAVRGALAEAPRARFGEAHALAAEIEVAWADALEELGDPARARDHLAAALEAARAGAQADPQSPEVSAALADCYRASRAAAGMERELARARTLHADPARLALIEGLAFVRSGDQPGARDAEAGREEARRAAGRLQQAALAQPGSARVHYGLAQALAAQHKEKEALAELRETLRLSPSHERAKARLEAMATQGGGGTR